MIPVLGLSERFGWELSIFLLAGQRAPLEMPCCGSLLAPSALQEMVLRNETVLCTWIGSGMKFPSCEGQLTYWERMCYTE